MTHQPHSIALLVPEIKELLRAKDYALLKGVLKECNPVDFADAWRMFEEEERIQIFKLFSTASALRLFETLEIEDQRFLLDKLSADSVTPILEGMDSPDLAKIFNRMPVRAVKKMTSLIKRQESLAHIDLLMKFPEHSAGSCMHPEFVKLSPKTTARQALSRLSAILRPNRNKDHLYSLFVINEDGRLVGALTLQDLISAPEDEVLAELMTSVDFIKVLPHTDREEVARLFSKYQLTAAPVTDENGKLLGVITMNDMLSVVRQEATEDIAKMVGTRAVDVSTRSILKIVGFRMPWLLVTLGAGMVISFIIRSFEPILAQVIALASFSPLIAGMGGNVGSQSATIVVRSIALGQINGHRKMTTVLREAGVGLTMGLVYGVLLGLIAYLIYGSRYHLEFSIVVAVGMCTSMTIAAVMGAAGPILLDQLEIDPATATGPLITTFTDIISNLTYFALATALLAHL